MKKVLIVVDFQNDFITGTLGFKGAELLVPKIEEKVKDYLDRGDKVIFTFDTHQELNEEKTNGEFIYDKSRESKYISVEHCITGSNGHAIHKSLEKYMFNDNVICINKYDKFGLSQEEIQNYEDFSKELGSEDESCFGKDLEFEIVGLVTNLCVLSVAVSLQNMFHNCEITIDVSCVDSIDKVIHNKTLDVMSAMNMNVININR